MKIIIDDQYQNDENNKYTMDEDGNINLFINIDDESGKEETINFNNNIESREVIGSYENNSEELKEDKDVEESFIVESLVNNEYTINDENPFEEEKYERNYRNIYEEIENNLQAKYSNNGQVEYSNSKEVKYNDEVEYNNDEIQYNNEEVQYHKDEVQYNNDKIAYDLNNNLEYDLNKEVKYEYMNKKKEIREVERKGIIEVYSKLSSRDGIELRGARINLYLLNGVSPKLYDSKFTDAIGKVTFNNLPNGCYRVIAIVDRRYFEKPIYYNWNEVTIDSTNKETSITVVNKIKAGYYRR